MISMALYKTVVSQVRYQRVYANFALGHYYDTMILLYFMMTSSNGTFSALLALCEGNSPVTDEFPTQRPVTRSFDVFFDLRLNKRLSKQSWCWWFGTPSRSLWRHCNVDMTSSYSALYFQQLLEHSGAQRYCGSITYILYLYSILYIYMYIIFMQYIIYMIVLLIFIYYIEKNHHTWFFLKSSSSVCMR